MNGEEKKCLLLNECVTYFKKYPVFQKLLEGFWEKYRRLRHWGGTVTLKALSRE